MTNEQITKFLTEFDGYFKERSVLSNKRATAVWIKFLAPLDASVGNALIDAIIFNYHFPPSPKQAQDLLVEIVGTDFKAELRDAIAKFSRGNNLEIGTIPADIIKAIKSSGGVYAYRNASEIKWKEMEKKYIQTRSEVQQQTKLVAITGARR